jgi:hypothetical protein
MNVGKKGCSETIICRANVAVLDLAHLYMKAYTMSS